MFNAVWPQYLSIASLTKYQQEKTYLAELRVFIIEIIKYRSKFELIMKILFYL